MRKILLLLSASVVLFSCMKKDEFVLTGTIKGIPDGKSIILQRQDDSLGMVPVDTVKLTKGSFKFEGKIKEPGLHFLQIENVNGRPFFILENGKINIEVNKDTIFNSKISGTYNNEQLNEYNTLGKKLQKRIIDFQSQNQAKMQTAMATKDSVTIQTLRKQYEGLQAEMKNQAIEYVKKHPKAFISVLLVKSFFNEFEPDLKNIETLYNSLDQEIKDSKAGKSIVKKLKLEKIVDVGKRAPEFSAPNPEGKVISLKESLGKVTIIDFWASWCKPCRAENPNVVALYKEFHDKGLNIIGVSLDNDAAAWKAAIAKDNLTWSEVSNLKKWDDPVAKLYNVNAIPKMFVLNQYGVVVAKDLTGDALKAKVATLLAQ